MNLANSLSIATQVAPMYHALHKSTPPPQFTAKRLVSPRRLAALLIFALGTFAAPTSHAQTTQQISPDWSLIPDGISLGESFRLLFVTSGTRDATSSDITDYNTFVQNQANAATGSGAPINAFSGEFRALISTQAMDARDNTDTNRDTGTDTDAPIYWLNGDQIAGNYAEFYDGIWDSTAGRTQNGDTLLGRRVWTGSRNDGTIDALGSGTPLGAGNNLVRTGEYGTADQAIRSNSARINSISLSLYALSPLITFTIPAEPTFGIATIPNQNYVINTTILTLTLPLAIGGTGTLVYDLTPTGDIPSGLTFDPTDRTLSGTPDTATNIITLTYIVTDKAATPNTASLTFTVQVLPHLTFRIKTFLEGAQ